MSKRVRRAVGVLYLFGAAAVGGYLFGTVGARGFVGLLSAAFLLLFPFVRRVFRVPVGYTMETLWIAFLFASYTLGTGLELYARFAYYDFILHGISGVLAAMTGLCLYERVRPAARRLCPAERGMATAVAFFFAQTVAMLWELAEYIGFLLTGNDAQNVAATGVGDTMQDMLIALAGSVIVCLLFAYQQAGHTVWLLWPVDEWRAAFRRYTKKQEGANNHG